MSPIDQRTQTWWLALLAQVALMCCATPLVWAQSPPPSKVVIAPITPVRGKPVAGAPATSTGVSAVLPGQQTVSTSGYSNLIVRYAINGTDTALAGQFCAALSIPMPKSGMTTDPPCSIDANLGPAASSNFVVSGNTARESLQIPQGVTQRAYQQAQTSGINQLFFVRQFASGTYAITRLHLSGSAFNGPLTLNRIELAFRQNGGRQAVAFVPRDAVAAPLAAFIDYQGTGMLKGRWEVVQPGDPEPTTLDLTPEANLPLDQRIQQHSYTTLSSFEKMIYAGRRLRIDGPPVDKLPTATPGRYLVLLRLEATRSNSTLERGAQGQESGASTAPLPMLTYFVTEGEGNSSATANERQSLRPMQALEPAARSTWRDKGLLRLRWRELTTEGMAPALYRIEITDTKGALLYAARIKASETSYQLPLQQLGSRPPELRWRVLALDGQGQSTAASAVTSFFLD